MINSIYNFTRMKQIILCIGILVGLLGQANAQRLWTGLRFGINEYNFGSVTQRYLFIDNSSLDIILDNGKNAETTLGVDVYFEAPSGFVIQGGLFYNFATSKTFDYKLQTQFGDQTFTTAEGEVEASTGFLNLMLGLGYNFAHRSDKLIISPVVSFRYGNGVETYHEDIFDKYDFNVADINSDGIWPVNSFYGGSAHLNIGLDFEKFGLMFSPGGTYLWREDGLNRPPVLQMDFTVGLYYAINLARMY